MSNRFRCIQKKLNRKGYREEKKWGKKKRKRYGKQIRRKSIIDTWQKEEKIQNKKKVFSKRENYMNEKRIKRKFFLYKKTEKANKELIARKLGLNYQVSLAKFRPIFALVSYPNLINAVIRIGTQDLPKFCYTILSMF